jgi:nucleotide-binding universal stress UspA family protein
VIDQVVGQAAPAVSRFAGEVQAMLVVMTTRGRTAYLGRTVRPVVESIVQQEPCPVMLVRPEIRERVTSMGRFERILLPLDGAPSSAGIIGPVLELALRSNAEVDILYVATRHQRPTEPGSLTAPLYIDQPQYEWPAWGQEFTERFVTSLGEYPLHIPTRMFLRSGEPATEILRFAGEKGCDLIGLEW